MAGSLAEPALTDFLDSFLAQPLDFRTQHNNSPLLFKPNGTTQGFQGQGSLLNTANGSLGSSTAQHSQYQPPEFLQAQTFTDVLANVANDWHQLQPDGQHGWGGSFMSAGDWNFDHSMQQIPLDGLPTRLTSTTDCSSNNSGDVIPVKQEDTTYPADDPQAGSDGESDPEVLAATKSGGAGKCKETPSGRAEQRRTRKREKDRIEELQQAIAKAAEDKEQLHTQTNQLAKHLQERDEELRKLRAAEESALPAADDDRLAASFEGVLKLTVQEGKEMVLTPEQIRSLTEQDLIGFWSQYVQRLRELLQAGSHPSGDQHQIVQKIHTLQREAMILHIRSAIANLSAVKNLGACGRLDGNSRESPPYEFWNKVTASLQLAPSQKGLMTELWQSFHSRIGKLMEVRASIHHHMLGTMPDGVFGRSFAINFLKAHELMDALKYNLRQEHIVLCDLAANFHKILTPFQNASCMVNSWPYWPNMPRIAYITAQSMHGC